MSRSRHDAHFAAYWVAQCARADRWRNNLSPDTGVTQPAQRELPIPTLTDVVRPLERDVLKSVLIALRLHPRVAWVERMNSTKVQMPGRDGKLQWVRFGFRGMADVTGQLRDGRRLEVECKRPGEKPTPDQQAFLDNVTAAGGVAFCATGVDDVMQTLGDGRA